MEKTTTSRELVLRLNRIEGQIGALKRGLEMGGANDCEQTLIQLKAATNALKRFGEVFAREYVKQCITEKKSGTKLANDIDKIITTAFTLS